MPEFRLAPPRLARGAFLAGATGALAAGVVPGVSRAADPVVLQTGAMPTDAAAQAFYAQELGYFKAAGLESKLTVLTNTASLASAASSGSIEIAYGSVVPLAEARARGIPFRVIAPATVYSGAATLAMMVGKNSTVQRASDLNGKTIAVNGLRDLTQYTVQAWVDKNGGDVKSIKLIEIPFSEMGAALGAGRIDAAIVAEPFVTAAKGDARILGNAAGAVSNHYMITCWFATEGWLAKNAEVAKRFAAVMMQTAKWANAHQKDSAAILTRYTKITPEVAAAITRATYGETKPDPALVQPVIDVAVKYGTLAPFSATELIWQSA